MAPTEIYSYRHTPTLPDARPIPKAEVRYQPKGVVGIISPWNFPVNLTFAPLAGVLAAGNRAMIKPSEFTPATSELMARLFGQAFDEEEVARSDEHTSELQSLMRISYAVFCWKKKKPNDSV